MDKNDLNKMFKLDEIENHDLETDEGFQAYNKVCEELCEEFVRDMLIPFFNSQPTTGNHIALLSSNMMYALARINCNTYDQNPRDGSYNLRALIQTRKDHLENARVVSERLEHDVILKALNDFKKQ